MGTLSAAWPAATAQRSLEGSWLRRAAGLMHRKRLRRLSRLAQLRLRL